ncbi:MAG: hypothetical protein ACK4F4_07235 [Hylemonella sp.]|uniref:hypothetical protein n=1 Tax=Hylemonella sp. TaxID=2066020 RepID=UPI00391A6ED7
MDQVFDIETLRKQCLDLLRKEGRTLSTGEICQALQLPLWAVESGMDSARKARLATFTSGAGWALASPEQPAAQLDERQGGLL